MFCQQICLKSDVQYQSVRGSLRVCGLSAANRRHAGGLLHSGGWGRGAGWAGGHHSGTLTTITHICVFELEVREVFDRAFCPSGRRGAAWGSWRRASRSPRGHRGQTRSADVFVFHYCLTLCCGILLPCLCCTDVPAVWPWHVAPLTACTGLIHCFSLVPDYIKPWLNGRSLKQNQTS